MLDNTPPTNAELQRIVELAEIKQFAKKNGLSANTNTAPIV